MSPARQPAVTEKVSTPFGSMYVCCTHDGEGRTTGARIFDPGKDPDSTVRRLIEALSDGMDRAVRNLP